LWLLLFIYKKNQIKPIESLIDSSLKIFNLSIEIARNYIIHIIQSIIIKNYCKNLEFLWNILITDPPTIFEISKAHISAIKT